MNKKLNKAIIYYIIFCTLICVFFSFALYNNYKQEKELAKEKITYTGLLISEWIKSSFQASDYILKDMVYSIPISALQYPATDLKEHTYISKYIIDKQKTVPYSNGVGLSDKNCIVTHTLSIIGFDGSQREWCKMLKNYPLRESFVSNMFTSNNGDFMVIQGRKFPSKEYVGQAGVGIDLKIFRDFLEKVKVSKNTILAIVDENQKLLARQPIISEKLGKKVENDLLEKFIHSKLTHQIFPETSPLDDKKRLYSLRKVDQLPFVVIVGEANEDWLANWNKQLYISLFSMLILVIMGWIFTRNHITINKQKIALEIEKEKTKKFTLVGTSIAYVTHQWKQPLSILASQLMKLQALSDLKPDDKIANIKGELDSMQKNISFINETLTSIRSMFKIESLQKEKFNLNESIKYIINDFNQDAYKNNITFTVECSSSIALEGNQNLFIHAVKNIIQNSIDAFLEKNTIKPKIDIFTKINSDNTFCIIIEDNGGGINNIDQKDIFDVNVSTKFSGMGIGLSMVKDIFHNEFKANITVQNIDNGVRFVISQLINRDKV